mmetsp:Transcript_48914/g.116271  ORF Transcript_48914/g.116271 Transcript_48914/m.116271 type:complete len:223 (+) Transcript_48914:78-746(+)
MGKKGGKKKKKAKETEPGVAMTKEENYVYLSMTVETLERELQVKSAQAEEAIRSELELRAKVDQMEDDFKQEQNTTFAVTADMARQYKALQEELIYKINSLETQLTEQKEELDITNHELRELIRDKDEHIEYKDQQISSLGERINEMSQEFANMLTETLDLMRKHVDEKFADGAVEDVNKTDYARVLQDYSVKAYNAVSAAVGQSRAAGASGPAAIEASAAS